MNIKLTKTKELKAENLNGGDVFQFVRSGIVCMKLNHSEFSYVRLMDGILFRGDACDGPVIHLKNAQLDLNLNHE